MNIDVLDEDGASNIAHSSIFGKVKTYPKNEQGVSNQMLRNEFTCKYCGRTDQFKQAADFHAQHCLHK